MAYQVIATVGVAALALLASKAGDMLREPAVSRRQEKTSSAWKYEGTYGQVNEDCGCGQEAR